MLAMNWNMESGCPQYRWSITKEAKPFKPSWFEPVHNPADSTQRIAMRGLQRWYFNPLSALYWLVSLFQ